MTTTGPALLFDENLSHRLVARLGDSYPGSRHVRDFAATGAPDLDVWQLAAEHDLVLLTKDDDFRQLSFLRGAPPKVVWLVVGNAGTAAIAELLKVRLTAVNEFVADPELALLVLRLPVES